MSANEPRIPASVGILTLNSSHNLRGALESVNAFDDRFISDGNSTDGTQALAVSLSARVTKQFDTDEPNQRITNFGEACTHAMNQARHQWFLRLDTDERMTPEAIEHIRRIVANPEPPIRVFKVPRTYVYRGTPIDAAMTYPNNQIRFFHREAVERWTKVSHEHVIVRSGEEIAVLDGTMHVLVADTYEEFDTKRFKRAMHWDRLQYTEMLTLRSWVRGLVHTAVTMIRFAVRLVRVFFFARGTKLPVSYELWRYKYLFATVWLSTRVLLEKLVRGNLRLT